MSAGTGFVLIDHHRGSPRAPAGTAEARIRWMHALLLVLGYVALDWGSYVHAPHGLNITPCSPAPALAIAFVMRFGLSAAYPLFAAIMLAEVLVRHLPTSFALTVALATILVAGYGAIGELLRRRLGVSVRLESRRALLWWVLAVAAGTFCVSLLYVTALALLGAIRAGGWVEALTRHWVGDSVGVLVSLPLIAMLIDERGRTMLRSAVRGWETVAYCVASVVAAGLSVGLGADPPFQYVYLALVPVLWGALRHGFTGAAVTGALVQLALIAAAQLRGFSAATVFEIQALAGVLVLLCFLVGVLIDEQRRVSAELRQSLRLAATGEMAGAIAHEINQPLTAMTMYGNTCEDLIEQGERGDRLLEAVRAMIGESQRTAEIVRRLRDFFRTGATALEPVSVEDLLGAAAAAFRSRAQRGRVKLIVERPPRACLLADRLQLEVVMRNLIANAFDAVAAAHGDVRAVTVAAEREGPHQICIRVEDSGPGLTSAGAARLFEPFRSTKASGLGLGLAISRAIAEAHGGRLWAEVGDHGTFKLVLPVQPDSAYGTL